MISNKNRILWTDTKYLREIEIRDETEDKTESGMFETNKTTKRQEENEVVNKKTNNQ